MRLIANGIKLISGRLEYDLISARVPISIVNDFSRSIDNSINQVVVYVFHNTIQRLIVAFYGIIV